MPPFNIQLNAGFEATIRRIALPNAERKIIQRAFQLSFDKVYKNVIIEAVEDSQLMHDLEDGVIAAIFGMKPHQQKAAVEKFRELFMQKSRVAIGGDGGVTAIIHVTKGDISKLRVQNTGKNSRVTVVFKWLDILLNGLPADDIKAKIMENIGVEEYVTSQSIVGNSKTKQGIIDEFSRSGHAVMLTPRKENVRNYGYDKSSFRFRIKPNIFLLSDIFEKIELGIATLMRGEFKRRLDNIPPKVVR